MGIRFYRSSSDKGLGWRQMEHEWGPRMLVKPPPTLMLMILGSRPLDKMLTPHMPYNWYILLSCLSAPSSSYTGLCCFWSSLGHRAFALATHSA